jgi:hypothetical protein
MKEHQNNYKTGSGSYSEQQIFDAIVEFETSSFSMEEFIQLYEIDEATFKSWNRKYNKMKGQSKSGLIPINVSPSAFGISGQTVLLEVERAEGDIIRIYRPEDAQRIIGLLIG